MNVLVDSNVVLDVLLDRRPFYEESYSVFQLANLKRIKGCLSAASVTDIFYFVRKKHGIDDAYLIMDRLVTLFPVVPVSETTIAKALALRWNDFEDAVQCAAATENGVDYIITRNTQDFSSGNIPAVTPEQFMQIVADM